MEFCRQEYWSGWPFPFPGDLPDPGIEAESPALQADSFLSAPGTPHQQPARPALLWVFLTLDFCGSVILWVCISVSADFSQCSLCFPLSVLLPPATPLPVFPTEQIGFDGGGPLWPGSLPGFGPESDC